jgi:phosphatidylglycerophosphatase A
MSFKPTAQFAFENPWHLIALGFGSGLSRWAPGTAGTIAAMPIAIGLSFLPLWLSGLVILGTLVVGTHACTIASGAMGEHDNGSIVIDEFAGLFITLWLLPAEPMWWIAGFLVFRLIDIAKPWPINWLDKQVKGGWGIMLDDVVAGLMSAIALLLAASWS